MPKFESAEYRPPIVSRPCSTARKPSACASRSSADPGSVMATNRAAACVPTASRAFAKKYFFSTLGSSVDPDLLETKNRVRVRSTDASAARTWAGSVESSDAQSRRRRSRL